MEFYYYGIGFIAACVLAVILTPAVKRFAFFVGAVDKPNQRKVHTRIMPRLGGLAVFLAFVGAFFVIAPMTDDLNWRVASALLIGGSMIVLVGALDDRFDLSPKTKLLVEILAALVIVFYGDIQIDLVNLPFGTEFETKWLSAPLTIFWIVGVTNAVNLIDGLDGLAAGVSGIANGTMLVMAIMMGNVTVILFSALLLGSIIGFLFYNFHPAKIFMGDSGALFLGFCLATLSVLGFKQATLVSFIVPILILGVPLSDTFFAIVRRKVNKLPISVADKNHLHHCLLQMGFGHRKTVLVIYGISIFFGLCAVLMSQTSQWVALVFVAVILFVLQLGAEAIGIVSKGKRPVLNLFLRARSKNVTK
ncbi:MraY family glycosyltransferase [Paenibacillus oceani]|uniref:Undecaprenyl/decaprenyl-phosphate alpha-N-acetylglucosaminyl 1-phosphate transferase n=1 Tax=Paenibacillus oceani TaxID=2772510 RepID=A0A927CBI3_9BACL|nr:MraY family glycosyltransferase [Paenibacillus oceani]MBD2863618.1 undecaprenyl/decaprenyl-phosphate alpha-N-acetylglucosaminyl 1-phosphate transferase [Paenibacillus oceani]